MQFKFVKAVGKAINERVQGLYFNNPVFRLRTEKDCRSFICAFIRYAWKNQLSAGNS